MPRHLSILLLLSLVGPLLSKGADWPTADADSRPWLRWRWPADLRCPEDPQDELREIAGKGFGGVEILPLEDIDDPLWPGPGWAARASATSQSVKELGLGFDLATQMGRKPLAFAADVAGHEWFPWSETIENTGWTELNLPPGSLRRIGAWPIDGPATDLIDFFHPETRQLRFNAPQGPWRLYGLLDRPISTTLDPFSSVATKDHLASFDLSLADFDGDFPRSRTFEWTTADRSDWTPEFFEAFLRFRGYDLREQLPTFFGDAAAGSVERVRCDYLETLADLSRLTLETWLNHTRNQGSLARSTLLSYPGNPLENHGVADFPGSLATSDATWELHLASSAAHLTMKPLVAATLSVEEASPPLPEELKRRVHTAWLQGANHVFFDGRSSLLDPTQGKLPLDDPAGLWTHFGAFAAYITRCQSILQLGAPDPDLLLYYPTHDFWSDRGGIPRDPDYRADWLRPTGYQRSLERLQKEGILFDSISDRFLQGAEVVQGRILLGGLTYHGLLLPDVRLLPERTALKLLELARKGARIAVLGNWPEDVPGFPSPDIRRGTLIQALQQIPRSSAVESHDFSILFEHLGVTPESMKTTGLEFTRRSHSDGYHYFVVNPNDHPVDAWVPLSRRASSVLALDPDRQRATRDLRRSIRPEDGVETWHLQLDPGQSLILRTFHEREAPKVAELDAHPERVIGGDWTLHFPERPPFHSPLLGSWRSLTPSDLTNFCGEVRYELEFEGGKPPGSLLDLGTVAHSARVILNGISLGSSFAPPHVFAIGDTWNEGTNKLEITVRSSADPTQTAGLIGPVRIR
ncbi:MAG: glycosyl hydrolase [Verrucomicrobiales bacterium]